jgi:hypothetical protein
MDLVLHPHLDGNMVALEVETSYGLIDEIFISDEAHAAITFVARESIFDVRTLPGHLSEEEQSLIAEVLEETRLFTRVLP